MFYINEQFITNRFVILARLRIDFHLNVVCVYAMIRVTVYSRLQKDGNLTSKDEIMDYSTWNNKYLLCVGFMDRTLGTGGLTFFGMHFDRKQWQHQLEKKTGAFCLK